MLSIASHLNNAISFIVSDSNGWNEIINLYLDSFYEKTTTKGIIITREFHLTN